MLRPGSADVLIRKAVYKNLHESNELGSLLQIARTVLQTVAKGTKRELFIKASLLQLRERRVIALEALHGLNEILVPTFAATINHRERENENLRVKFFPACTNEIIQASKSTTPKATTIEQGKTKM
jgi:hypothetical protein